jgi:AcrR family transcriptional regulator
MQVEKRRSNRARSDAMRGALIDAARALFVTRGFAATGTPEIVDAAGVTRGALYHHFADKLALFEAVAMAEAGAVAEAIRAADRPGLSPVEAHMHGGEAYLAAMQVPGRTRLLLIEAPAVLDRVSLDRIDVASGVETLIEGLEQAQAAGLIVTAPVVPLALLLSAAFSRAALALDAGESPAVWREAIGAILRGLAQARSG